jgi:mono/diheme cytochrome c family protein
MGSVSITATEIQAISDFLTGSASGSTDGDTSGGGGTVDGQALFTANCAACHGATGSGINGTSVSAISAAISNIASMSNVSVTATEIQAISEFLIGTTSGTSGGTTGGSTGGSDSGGPPASHTNAEDGVLHAPGNNYPYSNGCTACHGVTLEGAIGPSCLSCHGKEWNESAPSGGSTGGTTGGSTTDNQALFTTYCSACHGASGSNISGRTTSAISTAIANIGVMNSISLTSTELQAIADYLTASTGGGTSGSTGGSSSGLPASHTNSEEGVPHAPGNDYPYTNGCTSCHGTTLRGAIGPSCYSCHGQEWRENGSGSSGSSSGIPAGHTNSEGGVLHAPGNDSPYTNGCTNCHGATLQGAIGPSCYNCHGQEWQESGSTSSSGEGSSDGERND